MASLTRKPRRKAVRIRAKRDADRAFIFEGEDNDIFVRTGRQVIAACEFGISLELWMHELAAMIEDTQAFCAKHADSIRACVAASRGGHIVLFFIPLTDHYDFDLGLPLARLNSRLVRTFRFLGMIEVSQIPWAERARFIDPRTSRIIYGRPSKITLINGCTTAASWPAYP